LSGHGLTAPDPAQAARRENAAMARSSHVSRTVLLLLGAAGLGLGLLYLTLVLGSEHTDDRGLTAALGLLVGWSFVGTGLFAWWRRPGNRTGMLMAAAGFAWFATGVSAANDEIVHTFGIAVDGIFPVVVGHLLMAFPTGRLESRAERIAVGAAYFAVTVLQIPALLFEDDDRSLLVVEPDQGLSDALDAAQFLVVLVIIGVSVGLLVRRWRAAPAAQRRTLAPVLWTGGSAIAVFVVATGLDAAGTRVDLLEQLALALIATIPFGFLAGLLRSRLAEGAAVAELVRRLGQTPDPDALRAALSEALGDPTLTLAYWLPDSERFVDAQGRPASLRERAWTEVALEGRRIGALVHDPSLADEPELARTAGAAAALALENQRLSAELRARIEELRTSRARLVEAGDAERRRLERNLHDGAQSRLVALSLKLRMARGRAEGQPALEELLDDSSAELQASLDELRELARGIHPAVLSDRGLTPALEMLASRAPVPVAVTTPTGYDLPPPVATAIYFVVSEALTNVAKYARARQAAVTVERRPGSVVAEVADDGVGGADLAKGSGLRGLSDRVAALDGRLVLDSSPEGGTRLRAEFPL
jgi:signal transduction histidine kinase